MERATYVGSRIPRHVIALHSDQPIARERTRTVRARKVRGWAIEYQCTRRRYCTDLRAGRNWPAYCLDERERQDLPDFREPNRVSYRISDDEVKVFSHVVRVANTNY